MKICVKKLKNITYYHTNDPTIHALHMFATDHLTITPHTFAHNDCSTTVLNIKSNHLSNNSNKPTSWIILLHIGSSMEQLSDDRTTNFNIAKHAIKTIIQSANDGDKLALYTFYSFTLIKNKPITTINTTTRKSILKTLQGLKTTETNDWYTNILYSEKLIKATQSKHVQNTNIVITIFASSAPSPFGMPTWFDSTEPDNIVNRPSKNIIINTFGLGYHIDPAILSSIAAARYGIYAHLSDMETTQNIIPLFIENIKNINIPNITLSFDTNVTVLGYVRNVSNHNWHINIGQLFKKERNIVICNKHANYNIVVRYGTQQINIPISSLDPVSTPNHILSHYYRAHIASIIRIAMLPESRTEATKSHNNIRLTDHQLQQRIKFFTNVRTNLKKAHDSLDAVQQSQLFHTIEGILLSDKIFSSQDHFNKWGESHLRTTYFALRSEIYLGPGLGLNPNPNPNPNEIPPQEQNQNPPPYQNIYPSPQKAHKPSWLKLKFNAIFK